MAKMRAELIIHQKLTSIKGLIREIFVWRLRKSERYPHGVKYRLALVDPASAKVHLLYDNHWPKGHHVHTGEYEEAYEFTSIASLVRDFREKADSLERSLRENEKN